MAWVEGSKGRPSLFVTTSMDLFIGNPSEGDNLTLSGCELCGFNVGSFEERIVAGTGEAETNCLPWRLADDLSLVISTERKLLSLADFIHQQVTIHGLADFELRDHMLSAKQLPPVIRFGL